METLLTILKDYQSLIVATLTLIGVVLGVIRALIQRPTKRNVAQVKNVKDSSVNIKQNNN